MPGGSMHPSKKEIIIETGDYTTDNRFVIRGIRSSRELFSVYRLDMESSLGRGELSGAPEGMKITYPEFDHITETSILVAEQQGVILGSLSLTLDGPRG